MMDDLTQYLTTELRALLEVVQRSDVTVLEVQEGDLVLRLHRMPLAESETGEGGSVDLPEIFVSGPSQVEIAAPLVGTFYEASQPGLPPLVSVGTRVEQSTIVGIIEALAELTPVEAGCTGVVTTVLATDGQPVEYGQVLFEVQLDG